MKTSFIIGCVAVWVSGCGSAQHAHSLKIHKVEQRLAILNQAFMAEQSRVGQLRDRIALLEGRLEAKTLHPGLRIPMGHALPVVKLRPRAPRQPQPQADLRPPVTISQADIDALGGVPAPVRRLPGRSVAPPANAAQAGNLGVSQLSPQRRFSGRTVPALPKQPTAPVPKSPLGSDPAVVSYTQAYDQYRSGNLARAIPALTSFVQRYPKHDYADNALFWLGKAHFSQSRFQVALSSFRRVVTEYPSGNKVPSALLMIGLTQVKSGRAAEGRETLLRLRAMYPQTDAARKAEARLQATPETM